MPHDFPTPLWQLDAAQLRKGYAGGLFTPLDALEACLERSQAVQPLLNAMLHIDGAAAREAALASGARWAAGRQRGPLDGVPVTLKDSLHAAGMPTTWGSRLLQGYVAPQDELPVAALRAAGAVIFGKTNLPEFAMQGYTGNLLAGITRNPWDTRLTPGGSSGGAVAAVAAGCGPLALATDGGGSIRRPAAYCGLVGFKPSAGAVPRGGGLPAIFLDFEVAGAIGRSVGDVAALHWAIARGPSAPTRFADGSDRPDRPTGARVLFVPRFGSNPVDPRIAALAARSAGQLAALGCRVEECARFDLAEEVNARWNSLSQAGLAWLVQRASHHPEFRLAPGAQADMSQAGTALQAACEAGRALGTDALFDLFAAIDALRQELRLLFSRHDFILTPATAAMPWAAGETHPPTIDGQSVGGRGHGVFSAFANAAGLPAISLPCGRADGLPVGLQLVGPAGSDGAVLGLARAYEQRHPWPALAPSLG